MKDFFGNVLEVGDVVAFYAPGYRHFTKGVVLRFTPEKVVVEYVNTWNYRHPGLKETYTRESKSFIKKV